MLLPARLTSGFRAPGSSPREIGLPIVPAIDVSGRNIVATVNLECRLDLKTIALHARNAEYNPKVSLCSVLVDQRPERAADLTDS